VLYGSCLEKEHFWSSDSEQFTAEALLTSIRVSNLTPKLYNKWLVYTQDEDEVPDIEVFLKFLRHCISTKAPSTSLSKPASLPAKRGRVTVYSTSARPSSSALPHHDKRCEACKGSFHPLYLCPSFKSMNLSGKMSIVSSQYLCHNCLGPGHGSRTCRRSHKCKKCNTSHHTLLHDETRAPKTGAPATPNQPGPSNSPPLLMLLKPSFTL